MGIKIGNNYLAGTPDLSNYATKSELAYYQTKLPLLTYQYTDHTLNDIQWLKADNNSWQSGRVYSAAYDHLQTDLLNATAVQKFYQPKNCYFYGRVANEDGVISGFAINDCIRIDSFDCGTSTWEIVNKFRTNPSFSVGQIILHLLTSDSGNYNIALWITTAGRVSMHASSNGTSWNLFSDVLSASTLLVNTVYYSKFEYTGTAYNMYLSRDGENWTLEATSAVSTPIVSGKGLRFGSYTDGRPINAISLKESYYKIGDTRYDMADYITIYNAPDGHQLVDVSEKNKLNEWYNTYDKGYYFLIDTTNYQFKLPRARHGNIIEKYDDGNNWYKLYSDGWCEQGGTMVTNKSTGAFVVSFFFEYRDDSYTFFQSQYSVNDDYFQRVRLKTPSSITVDGQNDSTQFDWSAKGYIDESHVSNNQYKYLYYYVGNFNQTSVMQTAGLNAEDMADKVSKSSLVPVQSVVRTYRNGNGGYRLWSDGWCEQWGQITRTAASMPITFYQEFDDTSYNIIITPFHSSDIDGRPILIQEGSKTTAKVDCIVNTGYLGFYWKAEGFANRGL